MSKIVFNFLMKTVRYKNQFKAKFEEHTHTHPPTHTNTCNEECRNHFAEMQNWLISYRTIIYVQNMMFGIFSSA